MYLNRKTSLMLKEGGRTGGTNAKMLEEQGGIRGIDRSEDRIWQYREDSKDLSQWLGDRKIN